jgi:hypothetical protein
VSGDGWTLLQQTLAAGSGSNDRRRDRTSCPTADRFPVMSDTAQMQPPVDDQDGRSEIGRIRHNRGGSLLGKDISELGSPRNAPDCWEQHDTLAPAANGPSAFKATR